MFKILVCELVIIGVISGFTAFSIADESKDLDYSLWTKVLKGYVNEQGLVDYEKLKNNSTDLDKFIEQVGKANIDGLSRNEKKAFWINAYNALTVHLIVDKYPLKFGGIRTINWGRPWSIKMKVANQEMSLGDIEHKILRKWDPADPRIHFALNCASIGCPKLPNKLFDPQRLDQQLHYETKRFINDPEKVKLDREANILYHSELLNWYEEDFLVVASDQLEYIKKYLNDDDKIYLENNNVVLKSIKYDWGLNKQ